MIENKWSGSFIASVSSFLLENSKLPEEHTHDTPARVAKAYMEMVSGNDQDPKDILSTRFTSAKYDQIVLRSNIRVSSTCGHHLVPFIGKATFGYLPDKSIVGISKISRLVQCFSKRLQLQENLTQEIVDAFVEHVQPLGCGLYIRAYHFCEVVRGVREHAALTETTALRGCFRDASKAEFLQAINRNEVVFP